MSHQIPPTLHSDRGIPGWLERLSVDNERFTAGGHGEYRQAVLAGAELHRRVHADEPDILPSQGLDQPCLLNDLPVVVRAPRMPVIVEEDLDGDIGSGWQVGRLAGCPGGTAPQRSRRRLTTRRARSPALVVRSRSFSRSSSSMTRMGITIRTGVSPNSV